MNINILSNQFTALENIFELFFLFSLMDKNLKIAVYAPARGKVSRTAKVSGTDIFFLDH